MRLAGTPRLWKRAHSVEYYSIVLGAAPGSCFLWVISSNTLTGHRDRSAFFEGLSKNRFIAFKTFVMSLGLVSLFSSS